MPNVLACKRAILPLACYNRSICCRHKGMEWQAGQPIPPVKELPPLQLSILQQCTGAVDFAGKAAAIGFIRVTFPGSAPGVQRLLARAGTLAAVGGVAAVAVRRAGGGPLAERAARPGQIAWGRVRGWKRRVPPRWRSTFHVQYLLIQFVSGNSKKRPTPQLGCASPSIQRILLQTRTKAC